MNKDLKSPIVLALKRTAFMFLTALLIFSCNDDELEFDCEELELNIGDVCTASNDSITITGVMDANCDCITLPDSTWNDSTNVTYDCPGLMANIGDSCGQNGYVNSSCECIEQQDTTWTQQYDCPNLMQNFNDSCWVNIQGTNYIGVVNSACECELDNAPTFDCPELMQNFGDSCIYWDPVLTETLGTVNMDCECD